MPFLTAIYGETTKLQEVPAGMLVGEAIAQIGLPLEQPCAGRGTCGKCKVLAEQGIAPPDAVERKHLSSGELALNNRLACCARIEGDAQVVLSPIAVFSNKAFHHSSRYKQTDGPLGLAIDFGSTTAAAFLTMLDTGEVCAGAAGLNQQSVYGADVISRLRAAQQHPDHRERLHRLALASINQAIDALQLSTRVRRRIRRVVIVCNAAMHHLLARLQIATLAVMPFEPVTRDAIRDAAAMMDGIFADGIDVRLPPLIGGFVGSDALACLAYFGFDRAVGPMAAIDLGTNGEVLVTDGPTILTTSTAAGPAFEGVNISCGSRAVDGAVTRASLADGRLRLETIGGAPPIGLTGTGLLSLVHVLRQAGVIAESGRIQPTAGPLAGQIDIDASDGRRIYLTPEHDLSLNQWDVRELQKAKGAIRAAIEILMARLGLAAADLRRVILTGSFGGQIDLDSALGLGLIPPVSPTLVEATPNGAGLGAALFLSEEAFARGEALAARAMAIDLDHGAGFVDQYVTAMALRA